jgi:hypothetical protein
MYTFPTVNASGKQIWQVQRQNKLDKPMSLNRCIGVNCDRWDDYFMYPFGIFGQVVERVTF